MKTTRITVAVIGALSVGAITYAPGSLATLKVAEPVAGIPLPEDVFTPKDIERLAKSGVLEVSEPEDAGAAEVEAAGAAAPQAEPDDATPKGARPRPRRT